MDNRYIQAINGLSHEITKYLENIDKEIQGNVTEICLRVNRPLIIMTLDSIYYLSSNGIFFKELPPNPYIVSKSCIKNSLDTLTEYSIHSHRLDINAGFITINGGHRAGIIGSCVYNNNQILDVHNISSINLRVARQVSGVSINLIKDIYKYNTSSTLIAGAPSSGKTTLLKDIAKNLSNGILGYHSKVAIIDERGEVGAVYKGVPQNDIGLMSDVLDGYKKGDGISTAIRSMSPNVIIVDELSGNDDIIHLKKGIYSGVNIIGTIHASSMDDILKNEELKYLIDSNVFKNIVILSSASEPCKIKEIIRY